MVILYRQNFLFLSPLEESKQGSSVKFDSKNVVYWINLVSVLLCLKQNTNYIMVSIYDDKATELNTYYLNTKSKLAQSSFETGITSE